MRKAQSGKGGILIFLPGVQEIRQCIDALKNSLSPTGVTIFPLHANLSSDEQRAVFGSVPGWKVVVATNVAEVRLSTYTSTKYADEVARHLSPSTISST